MQTVYEAAGGAGGLLSLARAWHDADEEVSHAFSHGYHPQHAERLAAYWAEALGGPAAFTGVYGDETSVVRIHSGNGPHEEMNRRAVACFDQALADVGLDRDDRLRQVLHDYFAWATSTTMYRYHDSRMGWTMPWYTITDDWDVDFGVDEWHGTNAFFRDGDRVFRTYFVNNRGLRQQPRRRGTGEHLELPRHDRAGTAGDVGGLARGLSPDRPV